MKKLITLLAVLVILLSFSGKAQAVPYYYTFVGEVTSLDDAAGAAASQFGLGFGVGSTVNYTWIVDTDADGFIEYIGGTVDILIDETIDGSDYHYYYAYYDSGYALMEVGGGSNNADTDIADRGIGIDITDCTIIGFAECGGFVGNSQDEYIQLFTESLQPSDWVVGTLVEGANWAYASDGTRSLLWSDLTLTDISPVSAVPEPSTLLLLASGLAGLGFFRRKSKAAIA